MVKKFPMISYLESIPLCIAPQDAADDEKESENEASNRHAPEGNLERFFWLPPELC